ncbi:galactokinase [Sharpea azabuensis]|uniref:galactokinase n=1 Tax=Sharpea azabuensis TaxID=322505 RepID=UPI002409882D|nr:galactokinase family protein [Sharpea azabuensis]MDD6512985.1 galactokinase family protein [Sharpea azabuensis]
MKATKIKNYILNHQLDEELKELYVDEHLLEKQYQRYIQALDKFIELYGDQDVHIFTTSGRSEVGGNHTDHQHGRVLAAALNLDMIGIAAKNEDTIKILSDDYDIKAININDLGKKDDEAGTSEALIRGVSAKLKELGYQVGGFNAYLTSDVLQGSGMSSSAAFEDMIGVILDGLYNDMKVDMVTIAKVGQYAENVYFEKPCGLMDQCACAVGGLIAIDFKDPAQPVVTPVDVDFAAFHHSLCIVDAKGSHAKLTHEYAAIPEEMHAVAQYFGKEYLRDVDFNDFINHLADVREALDNDRAVLRAYHFFKENERVPKLVNALNNNDFDSFKKYIKESGDSSYKALQNVFAASDPVHQSVALALVHSEAILGDKGVCRVHGGGFAGTMQAFVEDDFVSTYKHEIEKLFGEGSCHVLKVRKYGGKQVL